MVELVFHNKTKAWLSKSFFERILRQVAKVLKVRKNFEVSLFLVGKDKIRTLNREYRGQDRPTDVLAFRQLEARDHFVLPQTSILSLGDIFICYPQAKKQAKEYKHSVLVELAILFVHGLLHLFGMDHEHGLKQAKRMMKLEREILKKLKF